MDDLSKIVKNSKVKVGKMDSEIDYLKKEECNHKEVKNDHNKT